jgi:hypothetical protein
MLTKPESRSRITTQVVPWVAGLAAEAVSLTPWNGRSATSEIGSFSSYQAMR